MKVLVTGGAGYIGAHVSELLQENGYSVRIFNDFSNGLARRVNNFKDIYNGDITDREAVSSFSNYSSLGVDLCAPGSNIFSTVPNLADKDGTVDGYTSWPAYADRLERLVVSLMDAPGVGGRP